jgi:membrane protein implicated in regulation of membrane protease activity
MVCWLLKGAGANVSFLSELSAFAVFLGISAIGFLFLVISVVFGEVFDHFDTGGHVDTDHGPSFFSPRVLAVFITAFGGFGAVAVKYGMGTLAASGVGFGSGLVFGWLVYILAKFLYGQQATTEVRGTDLVGQTARVVVAIPANGVGQVRCRVGEEFVDKVARSRDGQGIGEHKQVRVEEVLGDVVIVKER